MRGLSNGVKGTARGTMVWEISNKMKNKNPIKLPSFIARLSLKFWISSGEISIFYQNQVTQIHLGWKPQWWSCIQNSNHLVAKFQSFAKTNLRMKPQYSYFIQNFNHLVVKFQHFMKIVVKVVCKWIMEKTPGYY